MKTIKELYSALEQNSTRSAWDKGVNAYAFDLLDCYEEATEWAQREGKPSPELTRAQLLNGATDWSAYSWGGCSLVYDCDIAARLCTPSELKRTRGGDRRPNSREEWLDVQARALRQAARRLLALARA